MSKSKRTPKDRDGNDMVEKVTEQVEHVLVFPRELLELVDDAFVGGVCDDPVDRRDIFEEIVQPENLRYIPRKEAEVSTEYVQLIPYSVLRRGLEVFRYRRTPKGGEGRLHGKHSVGVGGHINPKDGEPAAAYAEAYTRELEEEVGLVGERGDRLAYLSSIAGLIYDPSDDVGKVHFGVVHFVQVPFSASLRVTDPALADGHWQHLLDLKASAGADPFESWSKLVIDRLL